MKKTIRNLLFEKEALQKLNSESLSKIEMLENEKKELQSKHEGLEKVVLKFSKGQKNLDKLLGSQRMSFNKEGIGYNPFNKKKNYKNFFVHETSKDKSHTVCNYCLRKDFPTHVLSKSQTPR